MYQYKAVPKGVVDGDTIDFEVDLGFHVVTRIRVRLREVDTPEIYGVKQESEEYQEGQKAKRFVEEWLGEHDYVLLTTKKGDEKGKYGRWLADVHRPGMEGDPLNEELIQEGLGERVSY